MLAQDNNEYRGSLKKPDENDATSETMVSRTHFPVFISVYPIRQCEVETSVENNTSCLATFIDVADAFDKNTFE